MIKKLYGFLIGFRKLVALLAYMLVMTYLILKHYVTGAEFAGNVTTALVAYFGTNISEHVINIGKDFIASKSKSLGVPPVKEGE